MKAETTLNQWVTTRSSMTRSHSLELKFDALPCAVGRIGLLK
jgi:hypothetical protein